jgi:hypothetical protein
MTRCAGAVQLSANSSYSTASWLSRHGMYRAYDSFIDFDRMIIFRGTADVYRYHYRVGSLLIAAYLLHSIY